MAENSNDIGQIRQLIFGETIAQFENKFKQLEEQLKKLDHSLAENQKSVKDLISRNKALDNKIETSNSASGDALRSEMKSIQQKINQKISEMEEAFTGRQRLGEYLVELGSKLQENQSK